MTLHLLLVSFGQRIPASLAPVRDPLAGHRFFDPFKSSLKALFHQLKVLLRESSIRECQIHIRE
eukprot:3408664-Rhodomonas_salina.1